MPRLFLLPISTRRTLIYCERAPLSVAPGAKQPISDRIIAKSSQVWTTWEKAEKGWQKWVTDKGNLLFRRIPFEEWGLKTIPPATKGRLREVDEGGLRFECLYPGKFLESARVEGVLGSIARDRQTLHGRKLWQSIGLMPLTAPVAILPVIPNLPFFYLCFRAYSHYRALFGGKMLEYLMSKNLVKTTASAQLDTMYTAGLIHPTRQASREATTPAEQDVERVSRVVEAKANGDEEEVMVLQKWNGKLLAEAFKLPEMEVEIERAVEQVEKAIGERKEEEQRRRKEEEDDDEKKKKDV